MRRKQDVAIIIFVILVSVFFAAYCVPVISGVIVSFTDWNGMASTYSFVGFDNYVKMFSDTRLKNAAVVTIRYAIILLAFSISFGYTIAHIIKSSRRGQSGILFLSFFPYIVTPVIVCVLWNQLFINLLPQIGKSLKMDFLKVNLLSNSSSAIWAVAFVDLWMLIPYAMLLTLSALNSIPKDLIEYAILENANQWKIFRYVEFPYLLPTFGMLTTIILSYALTNIDTIMALTAGGPGRSTETMYYVIYKNSTMEQRYAYGLAEGIMVTIISICSFAIINKLTNSRNSSGTSFGGDTR